MAPSIGTRLQLSFGHEFRHRHVHGTRNSNHGHDSRILSSAFDAAHVRAINRTPVRKFFLGDPFRRPTPANGCAKRNKHRIVPVLGRRDWHWLMVAI
jgi:hypothetical protein